MLDILQIFVQQVIYKLMLDIFERKRLEIITFDMVSFQLLQVTLEVIVENLGGHLAFQACPLIEIIINLLLELHEALI